MSLIDAFGRHIDYLRISITDRCNLKCGYCMPVFSGHRPIAKTDILKYEEIAAVAEAAVAAGVQKIRITGGEPLVRKDVVELCQILGNIRGLKSLAITTNGVQLARMAAALRTAGVSRVNISLDSLQPDCFAKITGSDLLDNVLAGIRQAERVGFSPVKINTVVMRGINDNEIPEIAALTDNSPVHVRFIELMPFQNSTCGTYQNLYVPIREIIHKIPGIERACISNSPDSGGPARLCKLPGAKGKVGFIAPLSWHFCGNCNRLRLTADGHIRTCLFSDDEIDIKTPLRKGASRADLVKVFETAIKDKPRRHQINPNDPPSHRHMHAIGG